MNIYDIYANIEKHLYERAHSEFFDRSMRWPKYWNLSTDL